MVKRAKAAAAPPPPADPEDGAMSSGTESDELDMTRECGAGEEAAPDSGDSGSESEGGLVNVEFVFTDPRPIDFKSVRRLLERYLPGEPLDCTAMADAIIEQGYIGTMVKVNDDQDVYAFCTALSVAAYKVRGRGKWGVGWEVFWW